MYRTANHVFCQIPAGAAAGICNLPKFSLPTQIQKAVNDRSRIPTFGGEKDYMHRVKILVKVFLWKIFAETADR